jgi:hypothetical protein
MHIATAGISFTAATVVWLRRPEWGDRTKIGYASSHWGDEGTRNHPTHKRQHKEH